MNSFERTFLVSVSPVNDLPLVAKMAASTTYQNVPVDIVIQASDVEGDVLSFSTVSPPERGDLNPPSYPLTAGEITLTYTPEWDFAGTDTFTFVVRDGTDASEPITASIEVLPNERPTVSVGDNVKLTVVQGLSIVIPFDVGDPDGDAVSVNVLSRPINGAVFTDSDLLGVLYTANEAFVGTDTFVIRDGEIVAQTPRRQRLHPLREEPRSSQNEGGARRDHGAGIACQLGQAGQPVGRPRVLGDAAMA